MELTSESAVRAESLYRFFHAGPEETLALRGVSLTVASGSILVLAGPSGSGKSTLMSCLSGLDDPSGGMVHIEGVAMSRRPETERAAVRRNFIGILGQSSALLGHLTVRENVEVARHLHGRDAATRDSDSVDALLESVGISHRKYSYPNELSGGEAVRAGLAVALANSPTVLLADEPTSELDQNGERQILNLFRSLAASGMAIVLASHSPAVVAIGDQVLRLSDGEVIDSDR